MRRRNCRLEIRDIRLHRFMIADLDVAGAAQPPEHLRPRELDHAVAELRIIREVALRLRREWLATKSCKPLLDVSGIANLAGLTVADHVDADGDLMRDD